MHDSSFIVRCAPRARASGRVCCRDRVEALYAAFQARGASIVKPLGERPWACVDFYVEDPDGYVLCFSEAMSRP